MATDWAAATSKQYDDSMLPAWMKTGSSPTQPNYGSRAGARPMAQQSYGGDFFRGVNELEQGRTNRNPFESGWSNFGKTIGGIGQQIGSQLNNNADRTANARSEFFARTTPFTQQAGAVPFGVDGGEFGSWLGNQASYRKHQRDESQADATQSSAQKLNDLRTLEPERWGVKMRYQLPYAQQLFSSLFGANGSGGAFGGTGGAFSTNFGAGGSF